MIPLKIIASGKALPATIVTAEEIDQRIGREVGYTLKKGGVKTRHFASDSESQSSIGARALHDALNNASLSASDVDLLIAACGVQEQALPSTACSISESAGLPRGTPAFDINASCLSFMAALQVAAGLLNTNAYRRIAIVSSDLPSRGIDWDEPEASLIFGDGAASVIVEKGSLKQGIRAFSMKTFTEGRTFCEIRAGGTKRNPRTGVEPKDFLFRMEGKSVFKLASKEMKPFLADLLDGTGYSLGDLPLVIPHQASHLGLAHMAKTLDLALGRLVNIYETHGNQVAASIPSALHEAFVTGRAGPGKPVLLLGTAAGLTLGGTILEL